MYRPQVPPPPPCGGFPYVYSPVLPARDDRGCSRGEQGQQGPKGDQGPRGPPGRDATSGAVSGYLASQSATATTTIPFATAVSPTTNVVAIPSSGVIQFKKAGTYVVDVSLDAAGSTSTTTGTQLTFQQQSGSINHTYASPYITVDPSGTYIRSSVQDMVQVSAGSRMTISITVPPGGTVTLRDVIVTVTKAA